MSGAPSRPPAAGEVTALTVHGPRGVVDLTVPIAATLADVSRAYSREAGLPTVLPLVTRSGQPLRPATEVGSAGLVPGSVLVAVEPGEARAGAHRRAAADPGDHRGLRPGGASGTWLLVAAMLAALAGWSAAQLGSDQRWPAVVVLAVAALLGCLPSGSLATQRVLTAPAFAAAACLAAVWDPTPERLPTVLGAAALAGAVTAAVGRALAVPDGGADEGLRVWMVVGGGWFVVAGFAALVGAAPQVVWSALLLAAVLGARFVPLVAVDVPDSYLIDLERLAVSAWSARERPTGRRGRIVVPPDVVGQVATRAARTVDAASVAILLVVVVAAPLLLWSASAPMDRLGARLLVGFGAAALLLAARSYRHVLARRLLRLAGVAAATAVAVVVLTGWARADSGLLGLVTIGALALAVVLVLVAVLVGRGWRSAWWSRRAEIAEAVCGALAIASVVVATGAFRHLWELLS